MSTPKELEKLAEVVESLEPVISQREIIEIKEWAADKVGLLIVDMDTQKILYATPGAEEIFGYMRDELINKDLIELVPNEFKKIHPSHVSGFNADPKERAMGKRDRQLFGQRRDGVTFPAEIGLFPRKWKQRRICLANVVRLTKEE